MSDTAIDMAKVTQMLDSGWTVQISKNALGSYAVRARHDHKSKIEKIRNTLIEAQEKRGDVGHMKPYEVVDLLHIDGDSLFADDFTPEQALTRLAYKVHGEII